MLFVDDTLFIMNSIRTSIDLLLMFSVMRYVQVVWFILSSKRGRGTWQLIYSKKLLSRMTFLRSFRISGLASFTSCSSFTSTFRFPLSRIVHHSRGYGLSPRRRVVSYLWKPSCNVSPPCPCSQRWPTGRGSHRRQCPCSRCTPCRRVFHRICTLVARASVGRPVLEFLALAED